MGVPRFGELVRRRYPKCWFNQGEVNVFEGSNLNLNGKIVGVDTIYVDGNGLLHPSMQYTFSYGAFDDPKRAMENQSKTEQEMIIEGTDFFLNAIKSLCGEFNPRRVVLAIDGSAPLAKMIQQRQRRFGAKMDLTKDGSLTEAWKVTLAKNLKISVQREESFVNIRIIHNTSIKDGGQSLIEARLSDMIEGSSAKKIYDMVTANLVDYSAGLRLRWYNLLDPETPTGFEFEGRGWYSLASAAAALAYRDEFRSNTWVELLSRKSEELVVKLDSNNRFLYTNGKSLSGEEQTLLKKYQEDYKGFKERNKEFFVTKSSSIGRRLKEIVNHVTKTQSTLYSEILIRTGVGTNLVTNDGQTMNWLMETRASLIREKEREYYAKKAASQTGPRGGERVEVEYPEYEEGFRGLESEPNMGKFDSNSLTPGTEVMSTIDGIIRSRIVNGKFMIDQEKGYEVMFEYSGHRVPGEGEHKIMNLIDEEGTDTENRTVDLIYGLDADLFMLAMVRNRPLCLIRENNFNLSKFLGNDTRTDLQKSSCHIVDIEVLRNSLMNNGIHPVDFTFLGFLFGNDFLRNVPGFVFDQKMRVTESKKSSPGFGDEGENPVLFDYIFTNTAGRSTHYSNIREEKISHGEIKENEPLLTQIKTQPMKIRWIYVHELFRRISADETSILNGLVRKMDYEIQYERQLKEVKPDYVPVNLRYKLLLESRAPKQIVVGGPLDQKGILTTDFRYEDFKGKWASHITSNIPGYRGEGSTEGLTRNKEDAVREICKTYLEGMEWAIKYYTNKHYIPTKERGEGRRSILDSEWYYPYSHAPLVSQLLDYLEEFILEDSRRMFVVAVEKMNIDNAGKMRTSVISLLKLLFQIFPSSNLERKYTKLERDILDLIPGSPSEFLRSPRSKIPSTVVNSISDILWSHYKNLREHRLRTIPLSMQYTRAFDGIKRGFPYNGENSFCERWTSPRPLYGPKNTRLIAPSTTNYRAQLLAVLPQQSSRHFPNGTNPSDRQISWMYPETISVDYTLRDRLHGVILSLPPPNLKAIETYLADIRISNLELQIGEGIFPKGDAADWKISETLIRKRTSFYVMKNAIQDAIEGLDSTILANRCVDTMGGAGISTLAAISQFDKVTAYEPNPDNHRDMVHNVDVYGIPKNGDFRGIKEHFSTEGAPNDASFYIFDFPVGEPRKRYDRSEITMKTSHRPGPGVPLEGVIEELIDKFQTNDSLRTVVFLVKVPYFKKIGRILSRYPIKIFTTNHSEEGYSYKIFKIIVRKREEIRPPSPEYARVEEEIKNPYADNPYIPKDYENPYADNPYMPKDYENPYADNPYGGEDRYLYVPDE